MKLTVDQRIEQGTKNGVMKFRPGVEYDVETNDDVTAISHEPRIVIRKVKDGDKLVRKPVAETVTAVGPDVVAKLSKVAKIA